MGTYVSTIFSLICFSALLICYRECVLLTNTILFQEISVTPLHHLLRDFHHYIIIIVSSFTTNAPCYDNTYKCDLRACDVAASEKPSSRILTNLSSEFSQFNGSVVLFLCLKDCSCVLLHQLLATLIIMF